MNYKYYISIYELFKNIGSLYTIKVEILSTLLVKLSLIASLSYNLSTNYFNIISDGIIFVVLLNQYFI